MATEFFQEWRVANVAATNAELKVLEASLAFIQGRGPAPTQDEIDAPKRLRAIADDLFAVSMAEFESKSAKLRRS